MSSYRRSESEVEGRGNCLVCGTRGGSGVRFWTSGGQFTAPRFSDLSKRPGFLLCMMHRFSQSESKTPNPPPAPRAYQVASMLDPVDGKGHGYNIGRAHSYAEVRGRTETNPGMSEGKCLRESSVYSLDSSMRRNTRGSLFEPENEKKTKRVQTDHSPIPRR